MGKLYDKRDLSWNTEYWNRIEVELYRGIADGSVSSRDVWQGRSDLSIMHTFPGSQSRERYASSAPRHMTVAEAIEHEKKRERFKLLRTGMLLRELDKQERLFKACPHCHVQKSRRTGKEVHRACEEHKEMYNKAKSEVFWAGYRNVQEREQRGQLREDDLAGSPPEAEQLHVGDEYVETARSLNKWESWYLRDRKDGIWPGAQGETARYYNEDADYTGWLGMLLQEEEITPAEHQEELLRFKQAKAEAIADATPVAGRNSLKLTARQRDTRFNRLAV